MTRLGPVNPVLQRELTERWRSARATVTLTVYLTLLAGVMYLLYRAGLSMLAAEAAWSGGSGASSGPLLGRFLFESLLLLVLLLVLFIAPGYAAAQLSGERERRTLPLLQATLLRPRHIVAGKLGASVAWILVLIVAALPLGAAAFFLGGVAVGELLRGVGFIAAIGLCIASIALGISSVTRRTTTSIVLTYGAVLALTAGTLFLAGVELVARSAAGRATEMPLALHFNPFVGLADAAAGPELAGRAGGSLTSPLTGIASVLPNRRDERWMGGPMIDEMTIEEQMAPAPPPDVMIEEPALEVPPVAPPAGPPPDGAVIEEPTRAIPDPMEEPVPMPEPRPMPMPEPEQVPVAPDVFRRGGPAGMEAPVEEAPPPRGVPMWVWVLGAHGGLGLAGLVIATRRLRTESTAARLVRSRRRRAPAGQPS